jgi:hypothetical protein
MTDTISSAELLHISHGVGNDTTWFIFHLRGWNRRTHWKQMRTGY